MPLETGSPAAEVGEAPTTVVVSTSTSTSTSTSAGEGDCGPAGTVPPELLPEYEGDPEGARVAVEQDELLGDSDRLATYGEGHPEIWAGHRFDNGCPVRLVASVTSDLPTHERALRELVDHPELLVIELAARTGDDLEQIQRDVVTEAGEHLLSAGQAVGVVDVQLRADGLDAARRIHERFGDAVRIAVGQAPFPPGLVPELAGGEELRCGSVPSDGDGPPGLVVRLELEQADVASGDDFSGTAVVSNDGDAQAAFESGQPLTATVVRPGSDEVVATFTGAIAGTGITGGLAPGEQLEIAVLGSTASCIPGTGPALPPGRYEVVVGVPLYGEPDEEGDPVEAVLVSSRAPLEVLPG